MRGFWCLLGMIVLLSGAAARAGEPVDVALVLAVDVSLSVNDERFQLQRDGIATDCNLSREPIGDGHLGRRDCRLLNREVRCRHPFGLEIGRAHV